MRPLSWDRVVAGLKIAAITDLGLLDRMELAMLRHQPITVASLNLHGVYVLHIDPAFSALHQDPRTLVRIDGMSVLLLARLLGGGVRREHRIAWIDLLPHLLDRARSIGWRVFYLGGSQENLERGLERLNALHPGVHLDGASGYFDKNRNSDSNEEIVARINAWRPNILLVGMGMGLQERWVLENRDRLDVPVVAVCGACLEYFAGAASIAPRWLSQLGLEWAFRLASNPRRFAWRYLVEPWLAMHLLAKANWRQRGSARV